MGTAEASFLVMMSLSIMNAKDFWLCMFDKKGSSHM